MLVDIVKEWSKEGVRRPSGSSEATRIAGPRNTQNDDYSPKTK
jgi:hypothetical protein